MPSILAMAGFLWLLAGLARRLIHPEAAWFAVFACLALPGLNYQAANARPYALGMCVFAAALLFLVRWLDFGRWRDGLWFAASAALVCTFTYCSGPRAWCSYSMPRYAWPAARLR